MRRLASLFVLLVLVASLAPASVAAASPTHCSVDVSPSSGSGTDVYRISGTNIPLGSAEVRIDIWRLGSRERSILFVSLVPGASTFYVDYNESFPGEPAEPLAAGRYRVIMQTAHGSGCRAKDLFVVA